LFEIYFLFTQGLIDALEDLMLSLEYRYYVKHLHANLKEKGWKGKEFKDALWGAARAPNEVQFKYYLFVIGGMDKKAIEYIEGVNPKIWSRHAFQITSCSDILQNNILQNMVKARIPNHQLQCLGVGSKRPLEQSDAV
jgi:hypothetical protein